MPLADELFKTLRAPDSLKLWAQTFAENTTNWTGLTVIAGANESERADLWYALLALHTPLQIKLWAYDSKHRYTLPQTKPTYKPLAENASPMDQLEYASYQTMTTQIAPKSSAEIPDEIREALRWDPDVMALCDPVDQTAMEILVRAALAGRRVFATIEAQNGSDALKALLAMQPDLVPHTLANVLLDVGGRFELLCATDAIRKELLSGSLAGIHFEMLT